MEWTKETEMFFHLHFLAVSFLKDSGVQKLFMRAETIWKTENDTKTTDQLKHLSCNNNIVSSQLKPKEIRLICK